MRLTPDRLVVVEGEPLHALAVVGASKPAVAVAGGLAHLRHSVEDVGFRDVFVYVTEPLTWRRRARPVVTKTDWIVWLEATPTGSASLTRHLTEELTIANAWDAREDEGELVPLPHPYAVTSRAPYRLAALVVAFGVAYPLFVWEARHALA